MPKRSGAVHVATIKVKGGKKVYESHLLRRSYREDGKVKHETLGNISHLPPHTIELVRASLRGVAFLPVGESFDIVRSLPHGNVAAVLGTSKKIGLQEMIASRPSRQRDLVMAMVTARVIDPRSKLATARGLSSETAFSTLGDTLGVASADEDELYEAMDWLQERQTRIEGKLARKHLEDGSLVLYDVSSSYYTGSSCPLAQYGYSRDKKKGFPQIVYGLLCNGEGCPVAVEVFEGNTSDSATLSSQIWKIRERFGLKRVVLVGDRGMITEARITSELKPVDGLDWITALTAPQIKKLAQEEVIQPSLFDEQDLVEITSPDYPDERLVACRNPLLAEDRARTREELLQATEWDLDKITAATKREKRALEGKDMIGVRAGKVINSHKVGKHFKLAITEESFSYERDTGKIESEAALDGIYVIRTSVTEEEFDAGGTVKAYKSLSAVERAFRCFKTVDLLVRPINHRKPERVRSHVFICMLAYYVEWHMRQRLSPILFDDEDKEYADALRESVVAPARRSPGACRKASSKRNADGMPVHSFQTLLEDLKTLAKNTVRQHPLPGQRNEVEFDLLTTPTPIQRKAFELLDVPLSM